MKNTIILIIIAISINGFAQTNIENIVKSIDAHNADLMAMKSLAEAQKMETTTSVLPENPEIEYGYFPGDPTSIGTKQSFSVKQSFSLPWVYVTKSKLSVLQQKQIDNIYNKSRTDLVGEILLNYIEIVYLNKRNKLLRERFNHAANVFRAYENKLKEGEVNLPEYNKTKLQMTNYNNKLQRNTAELNLLIEKMKLMTGNQNEFVFDTIYPVFRDIENDSIIGRIIEKHPEIEMARENTAISETEYKLTRNEMLPDFSIAYAGENTDNEAFRGITVGMEIPLWGVTRKTKMARTYNIAAQNRLAAANQTIETNIKAKLNYLAAMKTMMTDYKTALNNNSVAMLNKSLEAGNISIVEYLSELAVFYDYTDEYLLTEKEYYQTLVEMTKYFY